MRLVFAFSLVSFAFGSLCPGQDNNGGELYSRHCASCHGVNGRGGGEASEFCFPKPTDFSKGRYKLRSTPSGTLPSSADLQMTITRGVPGSAMPSFGFLNEEDRKILARFVLAFSAGGRAR
ncbi:MAG: cytochrome c [Acidobacteriaceae bacterium]|nr:cytochrome c [Acidobacteriaceae bacterium]